MLFILLVGLLSPLLFCCIFAMFVVVVVDCCFLSFVCRCVVDLFLLPLLLFVVVVLVLCLFCFVFVFFLLFG